MDTLRSPLIKDPCGFLQDASVHGEARLRLVYRTFLLPLPDVLLQFCISLCFPPHASVQASRVVENEFLKMANDLINTTDEKDCWMRAHSTHVKAWPIGPFRFLNVSDWAMFLYSLKAVPFLKFKSLV